MGAEHAHPADHPPAKQNDEAEQQGSPGAPRARHQQPHPGRTRQGCIQIEPPAAACKAGTQRVRQGQGKECGEDATRGIRQDLGQRNDRPKAHPCEPERVEDGEIGRVPRPIVHQHEYQRDHCRQQRSRRSDAPKSSFVEPHHGQAQGDAQSDHPEESASGFKIIRRPDSQKAGQEERAQPCLDPYRAGIPFSAAQAPGESEHDDSQGKPAGLREKKFPGYRNSDGR